MNFARLELVSSKAYVDGYPCICIRETDETGKLHRQFWVDVASGGLIRRFHGNVPDLSESYQVGFGKALPKQFGDTHIGIEYAVETGLPIGWTVVSCQTPHSPLRAFARARVESIGEPDHLDSSVRQATDWQRIAGAWVADEIEDSVYITTNDGAKRILSTNEAALRPTYEQLIRSKTGEVRLAMIQPRWIWVMQALLVLLGVSFLFGALLLRAKKGRQDVLL